MKKLGMKMVFSPPPGCSIRLGPVLLDKGYKQHKFELAYLDFQAGIDSFIQQLGSSYTSIITNPGLLDVRPFSWANYRVSPGYTYNLDLNPGEDAIWKNLSSSLRWEIKQAQKQGVRVVESRDSGGIDYLYDSIRRRYAERNLNVANRKDYLKEIFNKLGRSLVNVYLAVHDGNTIGATLYVKYKDTVTGLVGGARSGAGDLAASRYIDWVVISQAIQQGYRQYEEFGANTRHLCNAKSKYSPTPSLYFQITKTDMLGSCAEKLYRIKRKKLV
jgi:lipid II:glycine glycyltransferase (peptidoglycan interpeptide bridge formation enzyme)